MNPRLQATDLAVRLGNRQILSGVSFALDPGQTLWLQGESGSGKSTLLRTLARLLPLEQGALYLDGMEDSSVPAHDWRSRVCFLPCPPRHLEPTIRQDLTAPFRLRVRRGVPVPGEEQLRDEMDRVGLQELSLDRPTSELSQGQQARVALIRTLLAGPSVLLLDEPTANLDREATRLTGARLAAFVHAGGAAVVAAHGPVWDSAANRYRLPKGPAEAAR